MGQWAGQIVTMRVVQRYWFVVSSRSSETIWAATWENQQNDVRPAKTQIIIWSVFAVRMKKAWVLSYQLNAQQRLWSDWADAQADLSLRWAHILLVLSCRGSYHVLFFLHNQRPKLKMLPFFLLINVHVCMPSIEHTNTELNRHHYMDRVKRIWYLSLMRAAKHPRSLARTFAARSYEQWVKMNLQRESQILGPSEWLGMRS